MHWQTDIYHPLTIQKKISRRQNKDYIANPSFRHSAHIIHLFHPIPQFEFGKNCWMLQNISQQRHLVFKFKWMCRFRVFSMGQIFCKYFTFLSNFLPPKNILGISIKRKITFRSLKQNKNSNMEMVEYIRQTLYCCSIKCPLKKQSR